MTAPESPRIRRLAFPALLAASLAAPVPAPAQETDCTVERLAEWIATSTQHEIADENFACLQRRIDALEAERDLLARKLEAIESRDELASTVLVVRDGRATRDERHLGPATFVLTGDRRGRPRSLALDRARVVEMCGDAEGCLVSLGLTGIVVAGQPVEAMFSAGPCAFHLDGVRNAWAVSGHCAASDLPSADEAAAIDPLWGRDGDARPFGDATPEGRVILAFGGACLLTEAEPESRPAPDAGPQFERDTEPSLFLVAAASGWAPAGDFPDRLLPLGRGDPDFQCSLTIRD